MANKYGAKKVIIDGIKFDSKMEADYYEYLKKCKNVLAFRLQPRFILQEKFTKRNINFRSINYKADFEVLYLDGRLETIDIKGVETDTFKIKRKLFEYKYPQELKLLTNVKKFGGWIETDKLKELRKQAKKKPK